jgi:hypothetical protein
MRETRRADTTHARRTGRSLSLEALEAGPSFDQLRPRGDVLAGDGPHAEAVPPRSNTCSSLRTPALRSASNISSEFSTGTAVSSAA